MAPQDTFIEEEDDTCPLCIEEFDLSDRNFRPCPCGYQVCQFCFNNIKNNMNGLCPACRRPYDEKTIQWKMVTAEEVAEYKANVQKNRKKRAEQQGQKETQKRDTEKESRKNLVGIRVVQKNLVYVTGLTPTVREDELLKTLRQPQFFGQYGNIQKISISNRKTSDGQHQSLGIYVTFEKKEDAARCIQAVNGSQNGDRVLKAQLGTTKYCSAWLRHEQCTNRQCMFLHELGDEEDSYTRQDLSSLNSINSQRPTNPGPSRSASRQQGPVQPTPMSSQPMVRSSSKEESENGDASALPSSANWARTTQQRSRRGSHATSGTAASPAVSMSLPVTTEANEEAIESTPAEEAAVPVQPESKPTPEPVTAPNPVEAAQPKRDPKDALLAQLLKSMASCTISFSAITSDSIDDCPPLFDVRGGEKRRAMREEEEARLSGEHEEQPEALAPSEGEPESSGSLALGGEPEDREHPRESHGFDQRRPGAQPPIQRTNADALFGPAIAANYPQAAQNLASVTGRTMTPQQQGFMRPQGGFENLPPGISSAQSTLFQGQGGHNRQASRYSFANENSSASTSVKLAANPRIMAQQSSMMPSAFHSQPGGQYYGTSMPGPPPGLKSTGTPPSMFGQGQFGGSGFGATPKDSNELLQSLIRGRGGVGSQAHDAGKREYQFSTFSNQYPPSTSSTPAPSAGLLASLYGSQPGAFQDFGSKQKKKGKKHRHANTSSSGGSGLVDLADPSILQARMQHQQQSNAGVGQGLFGGQSSDDDLLSLDEATTNVDALVSDEPLEVRTHTPASDISRFGMPITPAIPPGLGIPPRQPTPSTPQQPIAVPSTSRQLPPNVPAPVIPLNPASITTPEKQKQKVPTAPGSDAKKNIKALAHESGLSKDIASQAKPSKGKKLLQDEDFPALNTSKTETKPSASQAPTPAVAPRTPAAKIPAASKKSAPEPAIPAPVEVTPRKEKAEKRPVPGVLNIAAATKAVEHKETSSPSVSQKADDHVFPALPTPTTASVSSPITRAAPKTLRVVPTPKTEAAPIFSLGGGSGPSVRSSVVTTHRPDTPASEIISDSVSIASASISASRTSSPPPSKVGSAAVRNTTKSQQRKQRKEAQKKETAAIAVQPKPEPEVEIAPILGRKKKQKKEKPSSSSATPIESRPATPVTQPPAPVKEETSTYRQAVNESMSLEEPALPKGKANKTAVDTKNKIKEATKSGVATPSEESKANPEKPTPTPLSILQTLVKNGQLPDPEKLGLLKPVAGSSHRHEQYNPVLPKDGVTEIKCFVTSEEEASLNAGKPVRKLVDGARVMLSPYGNCVRNLTPEEEEHYMKLQELIAAAATDPATFVHSRHEAGQGFSVIKGRAVPNGPPSYFPQSKALPGDPVTKMTRDAALNYINQSVLPRLNLGTANLAYPNGGNAKGAASLTTSALNSIAPIIMSFAANGVAGATAVAAEIAGHVPGSAKLAIPDDFDFSAMSGANPLATGEPGKVPAPAGSGGGPLANIPAMSLEDIEQALALARKETEKLEKSLNQVIKKNRRLLLATGGGGH